MEEGFSLLLSVLQIEAHESHGSQWSHSSRAFSLFFFCKMKGGKQEEVFLALHFLSLLKHPQRAGPSAHIKHIAMSQPQAPCSCDYVNGVLWDGNHNRIGSLEAVTPLQRYRSHPHTAGFVSSLK